MYAGSTSPYSQRTEETMTTHNIAGTQSPGTFARPAPGKHKAVIVDAHVAHGDNAQAGDWSVIWGVIDPNTPHHGHTVWDNIFTAANRKGKVNKAQNRFAMYAEKAMGLDISKPFDLDAADLIGRIAMVELEENVWDGKTRMKVTYGGVTPLDGDTSQYGDVANQLIRSYKDRAAKRAQEQRGTDNRADDAGNPY